jgi:sensor c-di-GMP phosphodiesterase-like protein
VYQPQIDIRSGRIVAAEALVRWNAPGWAMVMPGKFIPLLEDSGLVRHVTRSHAA